MYQMHFLNAVFLNEDISVHRTQISHSNVKSQAEQKLSTDWNRNDEWMCFHAAEDISSCNTIQAHTYIWGGNIWIKWWHCYRWLSFRFFMMSRAPHFPSAKQRTASAAWNRPPSPPAPGDPSSSPTVWMSPHLSLLHHKVYQICWL